MKTVDLSAMIVGYNFVISVLIMLSSQKLAFYAGHLNRQYRSRIVRLTQVSTFAFGAAVTALSGFIYVAFHVLRLGV